MAAKASTTDVPACTSCDICQKRGRWTESGIRCLKCELSLCLDCTFTHSWIPACKTHRTIRAGTEGFESIDVKKKKIELDSMDVERNQEGLDSFDKCLKMDCANVDVHMNTKVGDDMDIPENTKVLDNMDADLTFKKTGSVDVHWNTDGSDSIGVCPKREGLENEDVSRNAEGYGSVDVCRNIESKDVEDLDSFPQFVHQCEFKSKRQDEATTKIRAVLLLECGVILATDWANCTLKSFDMDGRFLGDCYFKKSGLDAGRVHGLALKDSRTVYVTLPSLNRIDLISIQRDRHSVKFIQICSFGTKRRYFGIAHIAKNKKLIVGTKKSVDIMTDKCQLVDEVGVGLFIRPYNIGVESSGSVLVSDTTKNSLHRIGEKDKVELIDVGEEKRSLRGVTVDGRGNIFFAAEMSSGIGWARGCRMMGWVLTDRVHQAVGVHYQTTNTGHWLVVSEKDGTIKVFRIK